MPLKVNHPYLYNILYMCVPAVTGAAFAEFNFALSLYFHRNRFLVLTLPAAILWVCFNFVCDLVLNPAGIPIFQWNLAMLPEMPLSDIGIRVLLLLFVAAVLIEIRVRLRRDVLA